ncbi:MAG TPA: ATP-binding cassette domain-containing protein [Candidatus Omnitrophota bacterium]|nr:ATP-binding cassette domain-containing protein [Candidatus Omnitrophota bacterium]HPS36102.1 ATP-binding cassette domain-containing protein [Candidatus Omnitrophota bacterium]
MISANGVTLQFGKRVLFENVNIMFTPGNCYGLIGANGSGKSTFLKILSGEIESNAGSVAVGKNERISTLKQDQFAFDEFPVLRTVIMGHKKLYDIIREKEEIYAKPDFSDADGLRVADLEHEFNEMHGWDAEAEAAKLLSDLGIPDKLHETPMKQLESGQKVRVLLAQALFGNPDVLLLDEPTNHLDVETCLWLEDFLYDFKNTAIVVSHDRHFLDRVCTHIADIDFGKIQLYTGNYSFWYESSQLAMRQKSESNKNIEDKRKELQAFIARFSANASKSRQATSRKKLLEKLTLEDIRPSSRRYPNVLFKPEREAGNDLLEIEGLTKSVDGELMFKSLDLRVDKGDKIAFIGSQDRVKSTLFQVLMGELAPDQGAFKWGVSTVRAYFPRENRKYFETDLDLVDWLRQFSKEKDENFVRGFLGRMLFSGEESLKKASVLSGGERVRCMLSRMMLVGANVLIMDEPTNHLDLESITALNQGLERFPGTILFTSHDHQFVQTVANRIIELTPLGMIERRGTTLDEYLTDPELKAKRAALYPHG